MAENDYLGMDDLQINPAARIPLCFCADISGSMARENAEGKKPIEELNTFLNEMMSYIRGEANLAESVEVAIVTFQSSVDVVRDFALCKAEDGLVELTASGGTALAHGVDKAVEILEARKQMYKDQAVDYYQPILVLITDGKPGDLEDLPAVEAKTCQLSNENKLSLFPVVIGADGDEAKWRSIMDCLKGLSPNHAPLHLKGLQFQGLLQFLGKSIERLHESNPGQQEEKTTGGEVGGGWGEW